VISLNPAGRLTDYKTIVKRTVVSPAEQGMGEEVRHDKTMAAFLMYA